MVSDPAPVNDQWQGLHLAYAAACDLARFKAGFLGRISHELRSPLNNIIGVQQLLLTNLSDDPAETQQFLQMGYESALQLMEIIDTVAAVSKLEWGTEHLELQPLALGKLLAEVYDLTHLQAENRNLKLQIDGHLAENLWVLADPRYLRQVLVHLVDTPIALMRQGSIHLFAEPDHQQNQVYLHIKDERPASAWSEPIDLMTTPILPNLSQTPFLQKTTRLSPGLTLLINQTLLELMGGSLQLIQTPIGQTSGSLTHLQCTLPLG